MNFFGVFVFVICCTVLTHITSGAPVPARFGILTEMVFKQQEHTNADYCSKVHKFLVGVQVDHLTIGSERCTEFAELHHALTSLKSLTQITETDKGVSKTELQKLYADLHYWRYILNSTIEIGTKSLKKNCIVEDSSSLDPCLSVTCDEPQVAEQELYCSMHMSVAPLLDNTMYILKRDLNMGNWNAPAYEPLNPPNSDMQKLILRYYTIIISHYITEELKIAKHSAPKYYEE